MLEYSWIDIAVHLALIPVYQIIGTAKHELAHALFAALNGLKVTTIRVVPSIRDGTWYWGYTGWEGEPESESFMQHVYMAPYYVDALLLVCGVIVNCMVQWESFHGMTTAVILLVLVPFVDVAYNLGKWLFFGRGNFALACRCKSER